jgi:hypothetical protein
MRHLLVLPLAALGLTMAPSAHACGMKMAAARSTVTLVQVLHQIQVQPAQPTILVARQAPVDAALPGAATLRVDGSPQVAPGVGPVATLPALDRALGAAPQLAASPGR